jgi:transposase
LSGHLFVLCNRGRNRIKVLFWDRGGWWLCCKRLEIGTFASPLADISSIELSADQLALLLSGDRHGEDAGTQVV